MVRSYGTWIVALIVGNRGCPHKLRCYNIFVFAGMVLLDLKLLSMEKIPPYNNDRQLGLRRKDFYSTSLSL